MSIRASLISFLLRHTIKKRLRSIVDVTEFRDQMAAGGLAPEPPDEVTTETIDAGGVPAEWVGWNDGHDSPEGAATGVLLYFHGGGYVFGGPDSHRDLAWRLAKEANVKVLVIDYRLGPEHPFPAAVDDATASYRWLLDNGHSPEKIAVGGDSAGGGLTAALLLNLKNVGLPHPKVAVLVSPWVDLALTGESMQRNADADPMLSPEALARMAELYLGDRDPNAPLASPLFADLSGLPPMMVLVGSTEVLFSDSERLVEKVNKTGGTATLSVWAKMPHVFPLLAARIPEGKEAITEISDFIAQAIYPANGE